MVNGEWSIFYNIPNSHLAGARLPGLVILRLSKDLVYDIPFTIYHIYHISS